MIVSCEEGPGAWFHQSQMLREAFPQDDAGLQLVNDPAAADFIFIADLRDRHDRFKNLREHPLVRHYPDRCFAVGEFDQPSRWLRGIQTSMTQSPWNMGRFHSGAYSLFHPDFINPYVKNHPGRGNERKEPRYLVTFTGRACHELRRCLFRTPFSRDDILIRDTTSFNTFTHDTSGKDEPARSYVELMLASKFALCPRGIGAASIRLFEAMALGVAPVIISDDWVLPHGIDWSEFALFVRGDALDQIEPTVLAHETEWQTRGKKARQVFEENFTVERYVRYLVRAAEDIRRRQWIPERWIQRCWPVIINADRVRGRLTRTVAGWADRRRTRSERQTA